MSKTSAHKAKNRRYNEDGLRVQKQQTHFEQLQENRKTAALHRKDPTPWVYDEDDDADF